MTSFFQNQICETKNSDFESCFSEILPDLVNNGWLPILNKVNFKEQQVLYNSISPSTFNEIWKFGKMTTPKTGEEFKSLGSRYNGKYQKFLTEVGLNNPKIKEYSERLIADGDFETMGLLQSWIYNNPKYFDLNNPNIQLIISIHYLTQNDQQKRTDKWDSE